MNIYELDELILSLKNEVTEFDNSALIAFYEKKRIELRKKLAANVNAALIISEIYK
jgi:hypothetical protein